MLTGQVRSTDPVIAHALHTNERQMQHDQDDEYSVALAKDLQEQDEQMQVQQKQELQQRQEARRLRQEQEKLQQVKLPDEPAQGALNSVTIKLKFPAGATSRRFLKNDSVAVLLDFARLAVGQSEVQIFTMYPRVRLADPAATLDDVGLDQGGAVCVEE